MKNIMAKTKEVKVEDAKPAAHSSVVRGTEEAEMKQEELIETEPEGKEEQTQEQKVLALLREHGIDLTTAQSVINQEVNKPQIEQLKLEIAALQSQIKEKEEKILSLGGEIENTEQSKKATLKTSTKKEGGKRQSWKWLKVIGKDIVSKMNIKNADGEENWFYGSDVLAELKRRINDTPNISKFCITHNLSIPSPLPDDSEITQKLSQQVYKPLQDKDRSLEKEGAGINTKYHRIK